MVKVFNLGAGRVFNHLPHQPRSSLTSCLGRKGLTRREWPLLHLPPTCRGGRRNGGRRCGYPNSRSPPPPDTFRTGTCSPPSSAERVRIGLTHQTGRGLLARSGFPLSCRTDGVHVPLAERTERRAALGVRGPLYLHFHLLSRLER